MGLGRSVSGVTKAILFVFGVAGTTTTTTRRVSGEVEKSGRASIGR